MIPNKLHFIFGLSEDFGGKPWSLCHYLAVKSALDVNTIEKANLYYKHKPDGEWFEKIEDKLNLIEIDPPTEIFGNPISHIAHQSDVIRLQVLLEEGGIYMDIDTISKKPFNDLLEKKCILGIQGNKSGAVEGLCNGVILAEHNNQFIELWLSSYQTYRSKGRDEYWAEHSVHMPHRLSMEYPELLHIEPYSSFHYPLYHSVEPLASEVGIKLLFEKDIDFENAYCHHLWETISWEQYLKDLSVNSIFTVNNSYNRIARKFLQN